MFKDRKDAGRQLALALETYKDKNSIVLAIPRGGIEVGYYVAAHLNADFSVIITRKLPFPDNPESGFGAIAEDGSVFVFPQAGIWVDKKDIERIIAEQQQEIRRRIEVLRKKKPLPDLAGRTVILVDDGIAMGSTMRASIMLCRNMKADKVVVGVPVAGQRTSVEIEELADDMVVLEKPVFFRAVAQVYLNWSDVSDEEALKIMNNWEKRYAKYF